MKTLVIKLAGVAVLTVLIVFVIVLFRHGRTSARPQLEKKQAVASVQDRAGWFHWFRTFSADRYC
jgi:hypothetical protein